MEYLFKELLNYSNDTRAKIVYNKCIRNKKYALAEKIKQKYKFKEVGSDMDMSFAMALMAMKNSKL